MIDRIIGKISIPRKIKRNIKRRRPFKGGDWDIKEDDVKAFKICVRTQLRKLQQGKCAYCGLKFDETSAEEVEHVAPKGGPIRPNHVDFTFTKLNLVLACSLCNGFSKKGTTETVVTKDIDYSKCTFNIVHPRLDDSNDHYEWVVDEAKLLIQAKSLKGKKSIDIFDLDSTRHSEARAKQLSYEHLKRIKIGRDLINDILLYTLR